MEYLAELFTAGDPAPVNAVLRRLAAMRSYMRDINLGREPDDSIPASVGMDGEAVYDMYRLLAIAKYDERYVIPTAHAEQAHALEELATECSLDYEGGPGMGGWGPFGESSGGVTPIAVENFHMLKQRQTADDVTPDVGPGQPAQLGREGRHRGPVPAAAGRHRHRRPGRRDRAAAAGADGRGGADGLARRLTGPSPRDVAVVRQVAGLALQYPDAELLAPAPAAAHGRPTACPPPSAARWPGCSTTSRAPRRTVSPPTTWRRST